MPQLTRVDERNDIDALVGGGYDIFAHRKPGGPRATEEMPKLTPRLGIGRMHAEWEDGRDGDLPLLHRQRRIPRRELRRQQDPQLRSLRLQRQGHAARCRADLPDMPRLRPPEPRMLRVALTALAIIDVSGSP